jgi:hypothetical protein
MEVGVVIPVGPGRLENLQMVLERVVSQSSPPRIVVLVCDGPDAKVQVAKGMAPVPLAILEAPKPHEPGMEQPRNVGARLLTDLGEKDERFAGLTHVWFLDSDVIVRWDCLEQYAKAMNANSEERVLVGPYEWLPPGKREPDPALHNDPRSASFAEFQPWDIHKGDLSAGLACFSGNLMWPLDLFQKVGGFWDELHHGRCEDGELGLRAVAMGIGVSYVREARGWHLWHGGAPAPTPEYLERTARLNSRDVPMLNARHPWKELGEGGDELFVVDEDGKRFNVRCGKCGEEFNSGEIWNHRKECHAEPQPA